VLNIATFIGRVGSVWECVLRINATEESGYVSQQDKYFLLKKKAFVGWEHFFNSLEIRQKPIKHKSHFMKKLLLLTDFSDASRKAIVYAIRLYQEVPCKFAVLNNFVLLPDSTGIVDEQIALDAQSNLDEFIVGLEKDTYQRKHSFEGISIAGNLFVTVSELYEKDPFDMLVLGASGTGNSVRLGSVATQMIRAAPCPVLVVPAHTQPQRIGNIVVATDYTNFKSPEVFAPVRELMDGGGKELIFLSVLAKEMSPSEVDTNRQSLLDQYFNGFDPLHYYVKDDSPLEGIKDYLSSHRADLLVTISHHRSLWDIFLNRSTSRILAYHAEVPLLVLKEHDSEGRADEATMDWNVIF
jgi:nucleotide-binding universal stress UspA family protein